MCCTICAWHSRWLKCPETRPPTAVMPTCYREHCNLEQLMPAVITNATQQAPAALIMCLITRGAFATSRFSVITPHESVSAELCRAQYLSSALEGPAYLEEYCTELSILYRAFLYHFKEFFGPCCVIIVSGFEIKEFGKVLSFSRVFQGYWAR